MDTSIIRHAFTFSLTFTSPSLSFSSKFPRTPHSISLPFTQTTPTRSISKLGSSTNDAILDEAAFEANRLSLDAKARASMAEAAEREMMSGDEDPKAWKWRIRKRVWDLMEAENIAQFPRPVHHRIPNFVGAHIAANKLGELEVFQSSNCVKVNPDSPQKQVRFLTLSEGKRLLTPQPRLRTGFFSVLDPQTLPPSSINEACTSVGAAKYGRPIGLDEKIKVDLIVIGSVAVDPRTGARLGKGEGFAELEYGMLRYMGAIDDTTPIVTTVHDRQLVDDIPPEKLLIHDVPVDIICTATQGFIGKNCPQRSWDRYESSKSSRGGSSKRLARHFLLVLLKNCHLLLSEGLLLNEGAHDDLPRPPSPLPRKQTNPQKQNALIYSYLLNAVKEGMDRRSL